MRYFAGRRTICVLLIMFSLLFAPTNSRATDLFMISGTKCAKIGLKSTVSRTSYTCTKKGKSFVWTKTKSSGTPSAGSSGGATSSTATTTTTTAVPAQNSGWSFDYQKSVWVSQGAAPKCSLPLIAESELLDFSKVRSFVQPGQYRGGSYKPHGGLRWSEYGSYVSGVTISAPFDGRITMVVHYKTENIYQFGINIIHPCGFMLRLGHLKEPSDFIANILKTIAPAVENDSRENFIREVSIKKGQVIATEVGMPAPASPDSFGTFMDLGILDLRAKNPILPTNFSSNADVRYSLYSVCWYQGEYLSPADRAKVQSLQFSNADAKSDYCKPSG